MYWIKTLTKVKGWSWSHSYCRHWVEVVYMQDIKYLFTPIRILSGAWISVSCECCVLSERVLCDRLVTHPEQLYQVWCVRVWSRNLSNEEMERWTNCRLLDCPSKWEDILITSESISFHRTLLHWVMLSYPRMEFVSRTDSCSEVSHKICCLKDIIKIPSYRQESAKYLYLKLLILLSNTKFLRGMGDNLKWQKIWEMCNEHLAGTRQKMSNITEKAKCGNLK